jgi:hypothetical protein
MPLSNQFELINCLLNRKNARDCTQFQAGAGNFRFAFMARSFEHHYMIQRGLFHGLMALALLLAPVSRAHTATEEMADAAANFVAALDHDQTAKAVFEVKDAERFNWHFIPRERKGLPIKEMTPAQRALAQALLSSALSQRGLIKANTIMSLEQILFDMEQNRGPKRDPERYFFSIFGQPGTASSWGWRVEGHHLSLNFTIVDGTEVSVTPSFMGDNPGEVRSGPRKGLRILGSEEDYARSLVTSLSDELKKVAIYTNSAPSDIITAADRHARVLTPKGVTLAQLNQAQSDLFWNVIKEYVYRYRSEIADVEMGKIAKAARSDLYFAWAGELERGKPHYYRVQGPTFLMEYDNTQNNANHVHAVWRDLEHDFGDDLLRRHYDETPHTK